MTTPAFLWLLLVWPASQALPDAERTFADVFATEAQCEAGFAEVNERTTKDLKHSCTRIGVGVPA